MKQTKTIALVAHDHRKKELLEWVDVNWRILIQHQLVCTGTTGSLIESLLKSKNEDEDTRIDLIKLKSGPLGGDQQLGAMIAEGKIDLLIFLWDPMMPQPHEVDVKALLRITVLYNVPTASNRASADYLITSPLFLSDYKPATQDFLNYTHRKLDIL